MQDFNRSAAEVGNIQLPFFVTTQVLRIEAVEWSPAHPSQVCMKLEAYGCLAVKPGMAFIKRLITHGCFNECGFRHLDTPPNYFLVMKPLGNQPWQPSKQRFASSQSC